MVHCPRRRQCAAAGSSNAILAWAHRGASAFLLLAIALLPVQMRAGASEAHPHSLVQLILDAGDGEIDHHHPEDGAAGHQHAPSRADECHAAPDVPTVEETGRAGSGLSILAVSVAVLLVPVSAGRALWPEPQARRGLRRALDPPPPRR